MVVITAISWQWLTTWNNLAVCQALLPPSDLMERHKKLKVKLENVIKEAFHGEDLQVEAYG